MHGQATQDSTDAHSAHTSRGSSRKVSSGSQIGDDGPRAGKSMGRYGLLSSISAADLPAEPSPAQRAQRVMSGNVTVNILPGRRNTTPIQHTLFPPPI